MAFVATAVSDTVLGTTGRGLRMDGYSAQIFAYTKGGGDTTGTVTTTFRRVHSIKVTSAVGAAIAAVATITQGVDGAADASIALTTLGAGTSGIVIVKGSKR